MVALKFSLLSLVLGNAYLALAQQEPILDKPDEKTGESSARPFNVKVSVAFPSSEIFGVKLVNGHPTQGMVSVQNQDTEPINLLLIGGALLTPSGMPGAPNPPVVMRNLTTQRYGAEVPAGASETFPYSFATEMHPQDLTLSLSAALQTKGGDVFTTQFYNGTVSVVEAPSSIFDPQIIFLYLVLAGVFGGTVYFIYSTWITTFFPQKRGRGKGGERAKKSSQGAKKVDPTEQVSVVGADGPAVTSSAQAKTFDQSWIPAHHLTRPEARRVASGSRTKPKAKGPVSPASP